MGFFTSREEKEREKEEQVRDAVERGDYDALSDDMIRRIAQADDSIIVLTNEQSVPDHLIQARFDPVDVFISLGIGPGGELRLRWTDKLGGASRATTDYFHEANRRCTAMLLRAAIKHRANAIIAVTAPRWQLVDVKGPFLLSKSGTPVILADLEGFKDKINRKVGQGRMGV